jgi:hypothetical protein
MSRLSATQAARFGIATSCIEKHGFALFSRHPVNVCGNGEVCHLHNSDRSMHMNLHPDDIAEVLAKGWGQRHPMAWGKRNREATGRARAWMMPRSPLPETFVLIYAPRGEQSLFFSQSLIPLQRVLSLLLDSIYRVFELTRTC